MAKDLLSKWTSNDSANLYGIKEWGAGYFDINPDGEVIVKTTVSGKKVEVSLMDIVSGLTQRGTQMPVLLRLENLLDNQISLLNNQFAKAIKDGGYQGNYRGVFPIKVNQQQQVIEEIARFGEKYHHGLEAGSKAELMVALAMIPSTESLIICNGYKDAEFFDMGLYATEMGYKCFFVIETPSELPILMERSKALGIAPRIGVRLKLSSRAGGHWQDSGGDNSLFGLTTSEIIDIIDQLKAEDMLSSLQLLHYHLGSQIPNIRDIRNAVQETARFYTELVQEGAQMGYLDLGGGLAVDYDGSQTNYVHSKNYTLGEYCTDIVEGLRTVLDEHEVAHPNIVTESGRATVAYASVLLFNVLDVTRLESRPLPETLPEDADEMLVNLWEILGYMNLKNMQECYNDALYYRSEIRERFKHGQVSLRHRALGENIFLQVIEEISANLGRLKRVPKELEGLDQALYDIYYCNFSVFQSLPDAWAIDQIFPIIPIHRHREKPERQAIIGDITCDSDGKIDKFADLHDVKHTISLHELKAHEEYYLGIFLVGAYQETLGDLHNLLGDTNIVSIRIQEDGSFDILREIEGDSVAEVISYVEYDPKDVQNQFRKKAEQAVRSGKISVQRRKTIVESYESSMRGYTYFER
ncbi:biosynthetic arginine decarboxylase [Salinispira pacifica]|uniref:Arginine decarboxylase n=1 Tax=Salinispira pacifica TaxID=1307761 RepID=V5WKK0_9SPIO|nr:biosynthetic arginine decarboxylase [Salinispira pacifica]AHC15721.1 Biosynthetic arginine decarboxylase [Salinispira pacifica]